MPLPAGAVDVVDAADAADVADAAGAAGAVGAVGAGADADAVVVAEVAVDQACPRSFGKAPSDRTS